MKATSTVFHCRETMLGPLEVTVLGDETSSFVESGTYPFLIKFSMINFSLAILSFLPFHLMVLFTSKWLIMLSLAVNLPISSGVCWIRCNHGHSQTRCLWWTMHVYTRFQVYGRWLKSGMVPFQWLHPKFSVFIFQRNAVTISSTLFARSKSHWRSFLLCQILASIKSCLCPWRNGR